MVLTFLLLSLNAFANPASLNKALSEPARQAVSILVSVDPMKLPENEMKSCDVTKGVSQLRRITSVASTSLVPVVKLACEKRRELKPKVSGTATWYGPGFEGNLTKCEVRFRSKSENTIAVKQSDLYDPRHRTQGGFKCGDLVRIKNTKNGRIAYAVVTDTGGLPNKPKVAPTVADLSERLATGLGFKDLGRTNVEIEICEPQISLKSTE